MIVYVLFLAKNTNNNIWITLFLEKPLLKYSRIHNEGLLSWQQLCYINLGRERSKGLVKNQVGKFWLEILHLSRKYTKSFLSNKEIVKLRISKLLIEKLVDSWCGQLNTSWKFIEVGVGRWQEGHFPPLLEALLAPTQWHDRILYVTALNYSFPSCKMYHSFTLQSTPHADTWLHF